ncbi:MAG TPA: efflux RND transporter periplasmic adaptor subunit [Gemmatimonadaceae bacterium]|nr:efflux RND transporter periplasmic adaptor subunit [Gemmatimonadaceae bacterium]
MMAQLVGTARRVRRDAVLVAGLALCTAGAACGKSAGARKPPSTPVRVAAATRIDAPVDVLASGVVEPMQTVAVTTQVSGTLLDVLFTEGQFVVKGQPLFRIDPRPLQAAVDQARASLTRDEAQAEAARRDDVRYKTLADMGYVSRSQSDQMHAAAQAQAATVMADRAALRAAQVNLGFATVRAPIAGRTGSLLMRRGNNVSPNGGPLVVINQLSPVLVRFPVLESDFPAMQAAVAAHPLPVTAASSDSTQAPERGQLTFLDNAVDSLTGTVTGKASFTNDSHRLWPGELVFLTIQLRVETGAIAVPTDAILTGQQGPYVFVVDSTNAARMRPVLPGLQVSDFTVVRRGVNVGERVVVDGQSRLNSGSRVAVISTGADTAAASLGRGGAGMATNQTEGGDVVTGRAGGSGSAARSSVAGGAAAGTGARGTNTPAVAPPPPFRATPPSAPTTVRPPTTPASTSPSPPTTGRPPIRP